jgi:DNA processing protein
MIARMSWLALALTKQIGPRRLLQVKEQIQNPSVDAVAEVLGKELALAYRSTLGAGRAEREYEKAEQLGVRIIGLWEDNYPAELRHLHTPPSMIYVKGQIPEYRRSIGIVGTRKASPWTKSWTRSTAQELAEAGISVVSGLARGIDTEGHLGCLDGGAITLGILGSALDKLYPPENRQLAERMSLLSEFPFGTAPLAELFPRRNRIIAALSHATLVVEAGIKSGSLITAKFALELGREVLAVPGRPPDPLSEGSNRLIQDGAALVLSAGDILGLYGLKARPKPQIELAGPEAELYRSLLELSEALPDDLAQATGFSTAEVLSLLMMLEIKGLVQALPGGRYGVM